MSDGAREWRFYIDDMIAWDSSANQPENIAKARVNGFEARVCAALGEGGRP